MKIKEPGTPFEFIIPDTEIDSITGAVLCAINPRFVEVRPIKDIFKPMTTLERILNKEDK